MELVRIIIIHYLNLFFALRLKRENKLAMINNYVGPVGHLL